MISRDSAVGRSLVAVLGVYDVDSVLIEAAEDLDDEQLTGIDCVIVDHMLRSNELRRSISAVASHDDALPIVVLDGMIADSIKDQVTEIHHQVTFISSPIDTEELLAVLEEVGAIAH